MTGPRSTPALVIPMTDPLSSLLLAEGPTPQETVFHVPEGWQQGRGVFGGLTVAMAIRALERAHAARPEALATQPLRTLSADLAASVMPGPLVAKVEPLRLGGGSALFGVRLEQEGETRAFVRGTFAKARVPDVVHAGASMPDVPPPADVAAVEMGPPVAPEFLQNLEIRPLAPYPFSGATEGRAASWIRLRRPLEGAAAAAHAPLLGLFADVSWSAALARFDAPRPMVTMTYTLATVAGLAGVAPDAYLLHVGRTWATHEGYSVEVRELWSEDGRLLAVNPQTFAILA